MKSLELKRNGARFQRTSRPTSFVVRCDASNGRVSK